MGNTSMFRQFSVLFAGLIVVQVINFLFSLVFTRYFTPEVFAEFGIFTAVVFILIEIINAKLDIALMLGKDDDEVKRILNAAFTMACIASLLLFTFQTIFLFFIPQVYLLLAPTIFLYGIQQPILVYWNKLEKYSSINIFRTIQVICTGVVTITFGILHIRHAPILGFVFGLCISTIYLLLFTRPKFSWETLKQILKLYDQFPKYGTWSALLNNFSRNSIPLLLSAFFPMQLVGLYTYATRLLNAPTGMYTSALGQVYFKKAAASEIGELKKITQNSIRNTFLLGIIPSIIILFFGREIFMFLFHNEWADAGKIAQYLILWYLCGVIVSPISTILDIKNKLKFEFSFNLILSLCRVMAILVGGLMQHFYLAIFLFVVVGIIMNIFLLYYIQIRILYVDKN